MELNDLQAQRAAKLERLRAAGVDPFPTRAAPTHQVAEVLARFDELAAAAAPITIAGRIIGARRIMGKIAFAHLEDGTGTIQLWISRADLGEVWFERFRDELDTFDIVQARGTLRRTKSGEASLFVTELALLAKAINPPPEKWAGLQDVEERHRQRYLDLIVNHDVRETFRARARAITAMRRVLDARGFLEVETPVLQPVYGGAAARPFTTFHNALGQGLYLRIATELYLKRLIVGGYPGVYEIGKNFRNEGVDRSHNPEFTMMECYQAYADYTHMMLLVEELMREMALAATGSTRVRYQGQELDFDRPWARMTMAGAILQYTGIDIREANTPGALREAVAAARLKLEPRPTWGKQVDELFSEYVQPHLVQPTFILDYPVELSPLAKRKPDDPAFTERFEAFVAGMEVGNAFTELNDPFDQEQRFLEQGRDFAAGDEEAHQMDVDFLNALLYGMPPTGGLGMGIDRIMMVLADRPNIREVILFPHMRKREE
ncbi:MAG: lysine--tRNA ligase [Chloroflexaceae bacterium]